MRYFISAVSHLWAMIRGHRKNRRCFESRKSTGLVSGKPGVSASVNGAVHLPVARFQRAAWIRTSSAVRSPEPGNQHTSRSPLGSSTIEEEWLCHFSNGKISSPEYWGAAAAQPTASSKAAIIRMAISITGATAPQLMQNPGRGKVSGIGRRRPRLGEQRRQRRRQKQASG